MSNGAESPPYGDSFVGRAGVVGMTVFLILLSCLMFYILVKVWPRCTPAGDTSLQTHTTQQGDTDASNLQAFGAAQPSDLREPNVGHRNPPSGVEGGCETIEPVQVPLFGNLWRPWIGGELRLLLIVVLAGGFGSLLHGIRSFYWYVGNRGLKWSWSLMYILLPFTGGILAMLFYFVVRGGFFSPQSTIKDTSTFAFAAFGGMVGLFSAQAVEKLKQIATTFFAPDQQGKDHIGPPPEILSISPVSGPVAGGTTVTITGTNFASAATLTFAGITATINSTSSNSISATTPAHGTGKVDVEVTNPDGQKFTLADGFSYV